MTYEELFTFENLYNSHLKARLCKRYKKEVIEFELNTGSNIMKLFNELKYQKYKISSYKTFYISDPKERRVDALSYRDRIVQHCLCDYYLTPLFERRLIYDNAATRPNKGTDFARKRLKHFYNDFYNKNKTNEGYIYLLWQITPSLVLFVLIFIVVILFIDNRRFKNDWYKIKYYLIEKFNKGYFNKNGL